MANTYPVSTVKEPTLPPRLEALRLLLKPIIRYCLRSQFTIQELLSVAKVVFVTLAEEEMRKSTNKINTSRLSVITGLRRPEVLRVLEESEVVPEEPSNLVLRVVGQWRNDPTFSSSGNPKLLGFKGENCEFRKLVLKVHRHLNPGTVLFDLERRGYIERKGEKLKLINKAVDTQGDPKAGFSLLSKDIDDLTMAVEENLGGQEQLTNLHIRTEYDNIQKSQIPYIRTWFIQEGKELHRRARDFLSQFDADINSTIKPQDSGARVTITAFSYTTPLDQCTAPLEILPEETKK